MLDVLLLLFLLLLFLLLLLVINCHHGQRCEGVAAQLSH
jgi:hypothetical protein